MWHRAPSAPRPNDWRIETRSVSCAGRHPCVAPRHQHFPSGNHEFRTRADDMACLEGRVVEDLQRRGAKICANHPPSAPGTQLAPASETMSAMPYVGMQTRRFPPRFAGLGKRPIHAAVWHPPSMAHHHEGMVALARRPSDPILPSRRAEGVSIGRMHNGRCGALCRCPSIPKTGDLCLTIGLS